MFFIRDLKSVVTSKTINHFLITSGGTAINGLLGLFFYIIVARSLGPSVYGTLAVAIAAITTIADIADLGIDTAVIRFVGKPAKSDTALRFIKLGLEVKLAVWFTILTLGWVLAPLIVHSIFLKPAKTTCIKAALQQNFLQKS